MCASTTRHTPAQLGFGFVETTMRAVRRVVVGTSVEGCPSIFTCTLPALAGRSTATTFSCEPIIREPSSWTSRSGFTTIVLRTVAGPAETVRYGCVTVTASLPPRNSSPPRRTGIFGFTVARSVTVVAVVGTVRRDDGERDRREGPHLLGPSPSSARARSGRRGTSA